VDGDVVRPDEVQPGDADHHPAEQFAEDGRLPEPLGQLAEQLRGDEDGDQGEEEIGDGHGAGSIPKV
jgi:hypothetical protein